jgi:hypothetical protein
MKDKVYFYHCTICDMPICNKQAIKEHTVSTIHNEKLMEMHPELNLYKDEPWLGFKFDRKEKAKFIIKQRLVVTMKRIVHNASEKKEIEQEFEPELEQEFDYEHYLDKNLIMNIIWIKRTGLTMQIRKR